MNKKVCYFYQDGIIFSNDKLDNAKKLKKPYIYVGKKDEIIEHGNFPNGWTLLDNFNLMDANGIEKKVDNYLKIFTIIQFKDWIDYYESLIKWICGKLEETKNDILNEIKRKTI